MNPVYTNEQLDQMSEPEINKILAEILAWKSEPSPKDVFFENGVYWVHSVGYHAFPIEIYCEDVATTSALMYDNNITLIKYEREWCAYKDFEIYPCELVSWGRFHKWTVDAPHKNPLRAIVTCLILAAKG